MNNWKERYEKYKKGMGYKNKDVANLFNKKLNAIEKAVSCVPFPEYLKPVIITYESMLESGRIVYKI